MRSGSQRPTSAGVAGCVTATPAAHHRIVAANSVHPSARHSTQRRAGGCVRKDRPRPPAPRPAVTTRREPAKAAAANSTTGRPVSMPISVPERPNSAAQRRDDRRDRENGKAA